MIATDNYITTGGDNGGPWYYANNAYGIHSGGWEIDGAARCIFTPVNGNLYSAMAMLVITSGAPA